MPFLTFGIQNELFNNNDNQKNKKVVYVLWKLRAMKMMLNTRKKLLK